MVNYMESLSRAISNNEWRYEKKELEVPNSVPKIYLFEVVQCVLAFLAHLRDEGDAGNQNTCWANAYNIVNEFQKYIVSLLTNPSWCRISSENPLDVDDESCIAVNCYLLRENRTEIDG